MLIKMSIFRKTMRSFFKKIYDYLFCKKKESPIKEDYCSNCREYLLNQADDNSSMSDLDYHKIYIDSAKIDSF